MSKGARLGRWPLREDFGDAREGPVDFFARDDQGRGDTDDGVVGFLAEDAFVF